MPNQHAKLSASKSKQWSSCTPSLSLESTIKEVEEESPFAREGTLAHELGEIFLKSKLGMICQSAYDKKLDKIKADELYSADMDEYVNIYVDTVLDKFENAKLLSFDAICKIEQRLNFSNFVRGGFGTGDAVIIADNSIEIVDLKYGKGVAVDADNNSQMMLYALGAINEFGFLYDIDDVTMTIVQPRLNSISEFTIKAEELIKWGNEYIKPRADLALKGEGEFVPGDYCRWCKARAVCKSRAEQSLIVDGIKPVGVLDDTEMIKLLDVAENIISYLKDLQEYALKKSLNGEKIEGYKLVEGKSARKYKDEELVYSTLKNEGYGDNLLYTKKLITITALEKLIGKKKFKELLGDCIEKNPGKPTLVKDTDKRPIYNSIDIDFRE